MEGLQGIFSFWRESVPPWRSGGGEARGKTAAETVPPSGGSGLRSSHAPKGTFPRETSEQLQVCLSGKLVGVRLAHMIVGAGKSEIWRQQAGI